MLAVPGRMLVTVILTVVALFPATALADVETFTTKARLTLTGQQPNGPIEVVDVLDGGKRAIATGGAGIQFLDLTNPDNPVIDRDTLPTGGQYTASVAVVPGTRYALAAVQRDELSPTDWLVVVDPEEKAIIRRLDIPKGPDSIGVSPDGKWGAVAIEDETHPAGSVVALDLRDPDPARWTTTNVAIPIPGAENLEPEYVDVNARHQAVVSLQENNAYAIVDLPTKAVVNLFSAGRRTSGAADLLEDESLDFEATANFERQPDAVEWMADGRHFISADEGETEGGRTWSIWSVDGELISSVDSYELDNAVRGFYPDDRGGNLGIEPEGAEVATIDGREYALIAGERNNSVTVYDISDPTAPRMVSLAQTGGRPEVVVRIPGTTRFITGDEDTGVSIIAGVDRDELDPDRPHIVSDAPWANLSGFGSAPGGRLLMTTRYGPNDIHELRPGGAPRGDLPGRRIVRTGLSGRLQDVAVDPVRGGYWVTTNQQALVRLNADGTIAKAFPSVDGFTSGIGVAVEPDGSAVYLATSGRTLIKVDPVTGAPLKRVLIDGPAWLASSSDRNRMLANDLDIAPGGRLAILLSATDRPLLQAGIVALPVTVFDTAANGANVTSQVREVLRVPQPLSSPRGVAALAIGPDGTIWTGNDADKGGESDVRRFPRAAALAVTPEPDGIALPSATPVLDAPLSRVTEPSDFTATLLPDATSYLVGGAVGAIGSGPRAPLARLRAETATVSAVGPAFMRAAGAYELDGAVTDAAGGLIAGGLFDAVDGAAHSNLVRLTAVGAVDPAFTVQTNGRVRALARAGNALYLAGSFSQVGGEPHQGLARVDLATGAVDPAFTGTLTLPASPSELSLAVDAAGGRVYIVGGLASVGGQTRSGRMAAVDAATGAVLPFAPTGPGNESTAAVVDGDLLIGGLFTNLRRYEADGTLTPGWAPPSTVSNSIFDIEVTADGVYAAGDFPTIQDGGNATRGVVLRVDRTTGAGDFGFGETAGLFGGVQRLAIADGLVYAAGETLSRRETGSTEYFRPAGGLVVLDALSGKRLEAPGTVTGGVRDILPWGAGIAFLGTADTRFADATPTEVTAIDAVTGRVDRGFRPPLYGTGNFLRSRLVAADERRVYLAANNSATLERTRFAPTVTKIDRDSGDVDAAFDPIVTGTITTGQLAAGRLYLAGAFTSVDGRLRAGLAAVDPDTGRVDLTFKPQLRGTVSAIAVADGVVYAGGQFFDAAGALAPGLKALDAVTGAELGGKTPELDASAQVGGLAYDARTKVLAVVGDITQAAGSAVGRLVVYDTVAGRVLPAPRVEGFNAVSSTPQGLIIYGGSGRIVGEAASQNRAVVAIDPRTGTHIPHFRPAVTDVQAVGARGNRITMVAKVTGDTLFHYLVFAPAAPTAVVVPTISGTAKEGLTLTCDPGRWDGAPETFAMQWRRGADAIAGATQATYVPVEGDVGQPLTCAVTGTNAKGSATAVSLATTPTVGGPRNTARPQVTLAAGRLSASTGEWDRSPTLYAYQWLRDGVVINGATNPTYDVQPADEGRSLTVRVTATNANGSGEATSDGVRVPAPPVNLTAPTISGSGTLTALPGEWRNGPAFAYAWLRDGVPIGGATGSTYTVTAADRGRPLSVRVTATTADGSAEATSSAQRVPAPPLVKQAPLVTGTPVAGATLTANPGEWDPAGATIAYQWLRDGQPIAAATGPAYLVSLGDADTRIAVRVRATNPDGASEATSAAVRIAIVAVNTALPAITGSGAVGAPLTASPGSWTGEPSTFAYQWQRDGQPLAGASGATYAPVDADEGRVLRVRVIASTAAGLSAPAFSNGLTVPLPPPPVNTKRPVIRGAAIVGETLTCEPGTFTGKDVVVFTRWVRSGDQVPGELTASYVVTAEDVGRTLACRQIASNKGGSINADSAEVRPEQPPKPDGDVQVLPGTKGNDGTDGADGSDGATGPSGPAGPKGDRGAAGRNATVTCRVTGPKKRQKVTCKVTLSSAKATLTRDGRVYARGSAKRLQATRTVTRGRYVLRAGKTQLEVTVR